MMKDYFFIRVDKKNVKVIFRDIIYVEASRNYINIVTDKRIYMVLLSLRQIEEILPENSFCRIHRSFIVSLDHVTAFDNTVVYLPGDKQLPVGERHKDALPSMVRIIQSDVRHQPVTGSAVLTTMTGLLQAAN